MKKVWVFIFGVILLSLYSAYYYMTREFANIETIRLLGIFAYIEIIYIFTSWRSLGNSWIDAYTVFIIAYVLFSIGQPLLDVFNATTQDRCLLLRSDISIQSYYEAEYVSMLFINFFHFGAMLSPSPKYHIKNSFPNVVHSETKGITTASNIFMVLSAPFYIYKLVVWAAIASVAGYHELYEVEYMGVSPFVMVMGDFFIPSVIAKLFISEYTGKKLTMSRIIAVCFVLLPNFYVGLRNEAVVLIMSWVIIYCKLHKITPRMAIIGLASLYLGLVMLNLIIETRNETTKSIEVYQADMEADPALSTITEMGFSMFTLCHTIDIVPDTEDWRLGSSYLIAPTVIIPNLGFWDVHPAQKYSNLGRWLTNRLGTTFGTGFSMNAEAYINFGYFGAIIVLVLGILYTRFFKLISCGKMQSPLSMLLALLFFGCIVASVRNSISTSIRDFFYYVIPIVLLSKYLSNHILTKQQK